MTVNINVRDIRAQWINFTETVVGKYPVGESWHDAVLAKFNRRYQSVVMFQFGAPNILVFASEEMLTLFLLENG